MFLSEGRHSDGRRVMSSDARAVLAPPVVGDIALLRLPAELQRHRRAVAAVLLRKLRPAVRAVASHPAVSTRSRTDGVLRHTLLAGDGSAAGGGLATVVEEAGRAVGQTVI